MAAGAMPLYPLSAKVTALRGVGPAFAEVLEGAGLATLKELLWSLPYRYIDRGSLQKIGDLRRDGGLDREPATVLGTVKDLRSSTTRIQRMALTEVLLQDETGTIRLVWFNQPYLSRALRPGDRILAFGPVASGRSGL